METLIVKSGLTEIRLLDSTRIIKLFHDTIPDERVNREVNNTLRAKSLGVRVPDIYDVITRGRRRGIVMEYIKGETITDALTQNPLKVKTYAKQLARTQFEINSIQASGFTSQRQFMTRAIHQSQARLGNWAQLALTQLDALPDAQQLCHNDLHQENIIFSHDGPVVLDWAEATVGNPLADIAHALLVQEHPVPAPIFKASKTYHRLHNRYRRYFAKLYAREYQSLANATQADIQSWLLPVAATRIMTKRDLEEIDWTEMYIKTTFPVPDTDAAPIKLAKS